MVAANSPTHLPPAPARLWVLMASEVPRAVIFRRAPSQWTRLYLWETSTDTITPGSWFHGRLYEWDSDLSPDGQHLTYLARNESRRQLQDAAAKFGPSHDYMTTWTALCKPPWVRALGLWNPRMLNRGGGVFQDNRTLILNHSPWTEELIQPVGFDTQIVEGWEDPLLASLQRTGWQVVHWHHRWSLNRESEPNVLRKRELELRLWRTPDFKWHVTYTWQGTNEIPVLEGASWADIDLHGRLVVANGGRLSLVEGAENREVMDLNLDQPQRQYRPA